MESAIARRGADDRQVERPVIQCVERTRCRVRRDVYVHVRATLAKGHHDAGQPWIDRVALSRYPDVDRRIPALDPSQVILERAKGFQQPDRAIAEACAKRRQFQAASEPEEQRRTKAPFEVGEVVAQGGLRQVQYPGRTGKVSRFRHRRHQSKIADIQVQRGRRRSIVSRHV